jgi:lysophospholipid acyltransferase (LPLAT)-like uncharacterized protein
VRPLRSPFVQAALAGLLSAYLKLTLKTLRWTVEGRDRAERVWGSGGGAVVCFWHGRLSLAPASWPKEAQPPRALISLSPDGEFIARAMEALGFPAIRGSTGKATAMDKAKGGAAAFREMLRWVRGGGGVAITPDGPRGPAETMGEGPARLAAAAGAPVLLAGLACKPAVRLKSWDRAMLPLPFGRGAIVWDGPFEAEAAEALGDRLTAATARAEAVVAQEARP